MKSEEIPPQLLTQLDGNCFPTLFMHVDLCIRLSIYFCPKTVDEYLEC